MSRRTALALFPLLALLAAPLRAGLIVVDPHQGPGSAMLQAALDAAQPGDVVLLRPGDYTNSVPFTVTGKGITLTSDPSDGITVSALHVTGVPAGQTLLLRGVNVLPTAPMEDDAFFVEGQGTLWIERSTGVGGDAWIDDQGGAHPPGSGLVVQGSGPGGTCRVLVTNCAFKGGRGLDATPAQGGGWLPATPGGAGLLCVAMHLVMVASVVGEGGAGGNGLPVSDFGANGGMGLGLTGTEALVYGGSFKGGDEGTDNAPGATSGPGGNFAFTHAALRGAQFTPGAVHGEGTVAAEIVLTVATLSTYPEPVRLLGINGPHAEFEHQIVQFTGEPGDVHWLFLSLAPGAQSSAPGKQGQWLLGGIEPVLTVFLGPSDADGDLWLDTILPALPVGLDEVVLFGQLVTLDSGQVLLGAGATIVWVAAGS